MFDKQFEAIIRADHIVWYYLNVVWHNPVFDFILPLVRNPWFWSPLYLFLLIFMPSRFGRKGWLWCFGFLITFAITDQFCGSMLKPFFQRYRPCYNPWLSEIVRMLIDCGGEYGFPSNHAANHFALGMFAAFTTGHMIKWIWPAAIVWGALVGYAQIYVGAHFPLDVLFGASIGTTIGVCTGKLFNRYFMLEGKPEPTT